MCESHNVESEIFVLRLKHILIGFGYQFKGTVSRDDFAFEDMHGHWSVLDLNSGRGHFLHFFRCSNDFITQKFYFSLLMQVCAGFIMLAACS
jgi:hypothetical protein